MSLRRSTSRRSWYSEGSPTRLTRAARLDIFKTRCCRKLAGRIGGKGVAEDIYFEKIQTSGNTKVER